METVKKERHLILFTHNNIEVEYHQDIKTVEVRWIGNLNEDKFKIIWQKVASIACEYQVENILLDATYVESAGSSVLLDSQTPNLLNQTIEMPTVKKIARITAGQAQYNQKITKLYSTLLIQKSAETEFKSFDFHYEAMDWLMEN